MLERHYHPSVRNFATSLMNENKNNKIVYTGDPLLDFSTSAFLERFSYRNPKQKDLQSIKRESGRGGKYSKRRRSNVAVIIVGVILIGSFLFYCLL